MRIECGCIKTRTRRRVLLGKQLRQLRDIDRNPPRLIFAQQFGGRAPAGLILEIYVGELLTVVVADNKAGV